MLNLPLQNICNIGRELILFNRQSDGILCQMRNKTFFPYYYSFSEKGIFRGYLGGKFNKIFCKNPWEIRDKRDVKVDGESDVIYARRFLLDNVNIIKSKTKWIMFDIETQSKIMPNPLIAPDAVTCITAYDNYSKEYKTFFLPDYKSEYEMISDFIDYIKKIQPDLLVAYNVENFDAPYLINRFPDFMTKISPIGRIKKRDGYPEGISIVDYYKFVKKVYKFKRHTLDYIYSEESKEPQNLTKYRFDVISDIIKEKNIKDVHKMVFLEERFHLIDYFDEQRRIAKVLWTDLCNFSVSIDGLILQTAKTKGLVLPSKPDDEERLRRKEEDEITGGYVFAKKGRYEGVSLLDVSGTYPSLIVTFNLDPSNKQKNPSPQTVTIRKIHILQNPGAIVPTVANRLINSRKQIQKELVGKVGEEYDLLKKQDEAHKSLNNSLFGILSFKNSRIYDKDIADTITYLARFLIRYVKFVLRLLGYCVISSDTDSIFVYSKDYEKIEKLCNETLVPRWLKHFGKEQGTIKFKYEGYFENIVFEAPKHYTGNFVTATGERKRIDKGIELVRRDSSKYQEEFLEELYNKLLKNESKESLVSWIDEQTENFQNQPLHKIAFPFQISQKEYASIPIFMRGLEYTDEMIPNFSKDYHSQLYYIYVKPFGKAKRTSSRMMKNKETGKRELRTSTKEVDKNVLVFDDTKESQKIFEKYEIDWNKMIKRNIKDKVKHIFEAMGWNDKEKNNNLQNKNNDNKKINDINKRIEELQKQKKSLQQSKFAEEVSKKIRLSSTEEGEVQDLDSAPNYDEVLQKKFKEIQINKEQTEEIKDFDFKDLEVKELDFQTTKEFIVKNHYSHTISSSVKASIGFFLDNQLVTAIVYGHPVGINVGSWLKVPEGSYAELIRVFSIDKLPKNTESYCLARSFEFLKENKPELKYLISYADPTHGHVGYIYQATNWKYTGKQGGLDRIFEIDGKRVHRRTANATYGTSSVKKLKEMLGNKFKVFITYPKHIYLMCLGNKKEKKEWYKNFHFLPYPKINNET